MGDETSGSAVTKEADSCAEIGKIEDEKRVKRDQLKGTLGIIGVLTMFVALLGTIITMPIFEARKSDRMVDAAFNAKEYKLAELVQYQGFKVDKQFAFADTRNCVMQLHPEAPTSKKAIFVRVSKEIWAACYTDRRFDVVAVEKEIGCQKAHWDAMERIRRGEAPVETPVESAEKK
ncbi:MAG: hypothetical protein AAB389_05175 [Patescibacteria group bacterium]